MSSCKRHVREYCCHREEGLLGLWKGVTPNIGRNAIINAAELASYDSVRLTPSECAFLFLCTPLHSMLIEWCWCVLRCSDCVCDPMRLQIKQALLATGLFQDTMPCHLASGLGAGFVAVCVGSPVDVVKSRLMGRRSTRLLRM